MRHRLGLALVVLALGPVAHATAQVEAIVPTFQLDAKRDVRGPLDIVRVAMSTRTDGTLRGELTMRTAWKTSDIGPGGSLCLKLYVRTQPDAQVPEYLVCATPPAQGETLVGRVLRNRANGLPRNLGDAAIARPTERTIYLSFDPGTIRTPATLRFAGESVRRGERCAKVIGCRDLAAERAGHSRVPLASER